MSVQNEFLDEFTKQLIIDSSPKPILKKLNQIKQKYKEKPRQIINHGIKKISLLLQNPDITMIECPGPQKYIIIEKQSKINPVLLTLSNQEVKQIIEYFSKKTNTPITKPTYKAKLNNMVLTSINSEFGGKKFIITKTLSIPSRFL